MQQRYQRLTSKSINLIYCFNGLSRLCGGCVGSHAFLRLLFQGFCESRVRAVASADRASARISAFSMKYASRMTCISSVYTMKAALLVAAVGAAAASASVPECAQDPSAVGCGNIAVDQIHLSFADDPTKLWVQWATSNVTTGPGYHPSVRHGPSVPLQYVAFNVGFSDNYTSWGVTSDVLHFVNLTNLVPGGVPWYYSVGDPAHGYSPILRIQTPLAPGQWPGSGNGSAVHIVALGDIGVEKSADTMATVTQVVQAATAAGDYIFTHLNGDFSYADDRQQLYNGTIADGFVSQFYSMLNATFAPLAPATFSIGNHELQLGDVPNCQPGVGDGRCKGLAYDKRIATTLPYNASGSTTPYWYSVNIGPIHMISLSFEHAYEQGSPQWTWLQGDLAAVNRSVTPWVVAGVHRPLYTSNNMTWPNADAMRGAMEPLFVGPNGGAAGGAPAVDIVITSHVHCLERLWQIAGNGSFVKQSYEGMSTPLYILTGAAGCMEGSTPWNEPQPSWSAYRACESTAFGFSTLHFYNATTACVDFVNSANGEVMDHSCITRQVA